MFWKVKAIFIVEGQMLLAPKWRIVNANSLTTEELKDIMKTLEIQ